jgi:hypothetical protein
MTKTPAKSSFALDPSDDLHDLRMSEKAGRCTSTSSASSRKPSTR